MGLSAQLDGIEPKQILAEKFSRTMQLKAVLEAVSA